jgi:RNA polymerase sigma factor (sigma-70 family)
MPFSERHDSTADLRSRLDARFRGPLMTFFLRRVRDRAAAEDLTQETLLRVLGAQAPERIENAESYVFKIAANLLRDHKHRSHKFNPAVCVPIDAALAGELERQLVEELSPEAVLLGKDTLREALQTLEELGERTRDIFILFRLENMKQRDIAKALGIGQSTVEKHVMKATLHLAAIHGGKGKR